MPKRIENSSVSIEQRQKLISALACFSMLTQKESSELAGLMREVEYQPHEVIVVEDAMVDSVFIVVQGQAEVTRQSAIKSKLSRKVKMTQAPVATLGVGDVIGLNDTGFFSITGKRTATVSASSKTNVLVLDLKELHEFLKKYPHLQPAMFAAAAKILKIRLIKQSLPFNRLAHERLEWLANKVEEVHIPAGTVIFRQGEPGDQCYLIRSGEVEIISMNEQNEEHHLATLKTPTLFGEATLITRSPRNATARALTDCELLMLRHEYLSELLETEKNVADTFMTLMIDRSRPLKNASVTVHERTTADGQQIVILKNADTGNYFKLSQEGWFVWQQLDGKQSMQEITLALAKQFGIFAPDIVAALISRLGRSGYVTHVEVENSNASSKKQPLWVRAMFQVRRVLEARMAIGDADKFLTKIYQKGIYLLFTKIGQIILMVLALSGIAAFGFSTENVLTTFQLLPHTWVLLVILVPFTMLTVVTHEFGHAFAVKSFGHEVHYMGVGWYWLSPIAFTDTSDMWLSTRWPRVIVNIAGVFTDILMAGIASLLLLVIVNPYIQAFLWIFSLYTYINAFRMLSPLQEWDGYYILMDLLDRPRLRQSSVLWLIKIFPKSLRNPKLFKKHIPEICYWLYCIFFLLVVSVLTLLLQTFVFKILGIHSSNIFISLSLPFLVVLMSCLGILADLRGKD